MSKYQFTDDMREISGFGGGYEKTCRDMVIAGMEWLDANPDAKPEFEGYKNIFGVIKETNEDAEKLTKIVAEAANNDYIGAMHQATISHILFAHHNGWEIYQEKMRNTGGENE